MMRNSLAPEGIGCLERGAPRTSSRSNEPKDQEFMDMVAQCFLFGVEPRSGFDNPLQNGKSANTIYLTRR
jgi:hypothetical protein